MDISSFINYDNCLTNLSASVCRRYGLETKHKTLKAADEVLALNKRNVVLMLLDGLGCDILKKTTSAGGFFQRHCITEYKSVFPPTTTAATTSLVSGLNPSEHGWLGWTQYFPQEDKDVVIFTNRDSVTGEYYGGKMFAEKYLPYDSIVNEIQKNGAANSHYFASFQMRCSFNGFCNAVVEACKGEGKNFVYAYWNQPDNFLHKRGLDESVKDYILQMENTVKEMCGKLKDTSVLITADHGHSEIKYFVLEDYPEINKMLLRPATMEQRTISFYVKSENMQAFPPAFKNAFGDNFLLLSREQFIESGLLGPGGVRGDIGQYIGDYVALSIGKRGMANFYKDAGLKSQHAGLTHEEMDIPLMAINCK